MFKISIAQNFGGDELSPLCYLKDNPDERRLPVEVPANISNKSIICILWILFPFVEFLYLGKLYYYSVAYWKAYSSILDIHVTVIIPLIPPPSIVIILYGFS